jgi:hypothetical protein
MTTLGHPTTTQKFITKLNDIQKMWFHLDGDMNQLCTVFSHISFFNSLWCSCQPYLLTVNHFVLCCYQSHLLACLLTYLWHQSKLSHEHIIHSWAKQKLCPWNPINVHRSLLSLEGKFIWEKRTYKILVQNKLLASSLQIWQ